jgi:hypothetical protein
MGSEMKRIVAKRGYVVIGEFLVLSSGLAAIPAVVAVLSWSLG